ncbi:hypothetical protein [Methanoregula sp.]|uniref:hypothetical protein n=1 Tax=Methanoregula sp. TaxID=2052170 RepID=UPI003563477E
MTVMSTVVPLEPDGLVAELCISLLTVNNGAIVLNFIVVALANPVPFIRMWVGL